MVVQQLPTVEMLSGRVEVLYRASVSLQKLVTNKGFSISFPGQRSGHLTKRHLRRGPDGFHHVNENA